MSRLLFFWGIPKRYLGLYLFFLGFLDSCHYNSPTLEECHYFSRYWKLAIKILQSSQTCPDLRLLRLWAHCQGAFLRMRTVLPLLFLFKPSGRLEPTPLASPRLLLPRLVFSLPFPIPEQTTETLTLEIDGGGVIRSGD